MIDENNFEYQGQKYKAVEADAHIACIGCAFLDTACCSSVYGGSSCISRHRNDGREVIWVKQDA